MKVAATFALAVIAPAIASIVAASPANADDVATLQSAVREALHAAHSFTLTFEPSADAHGAGGRITYVVVEPGRFHQTFRAASDAVVETIVIGDVLYDRPDAGVFHFLPFAKERQTAFLAPLFDVSVVSIGADVVENGATHGSFVARDPLADDETTTVTCTYDRATYRPIVCRGAQLVMTYARYDDPTLAVEKPPGALPYP